MAEDNLAHQRITEYALKKCKSPYVLKVVHDGQEVLDYLFRNNAFSDLQDSPLPDIILLDLNLPKRDGREVLKVIKGIPSLQKIPVVIVSTSDREEDLSYAFSLGAIAYISKSSGFDTYNEQISTIDQYLQANS